MLFASEELHHPSMGRRVGKNGPKMRGKKSSFPSFLWPPYTTVRLERMESFRRVRMLTVPMFTCVKIRYYLQCLFLPPVHPDSPERYPLHTIPICLPFLQRTALRVESRQLENDIDGKLQAFSKLGRDVGRSGGGG